MKIETKIIIDRPIERVWEVFTAFGQYPEWNPFVKELTGEIRKGNQIAIRLPGMRFKPLVLKYNVNEELRWKGRLFLPKVFDGEHYFQLRAIDHDRTSFIHGEIFKGILVPLMRKKINTEVKDGFIAMNEALKARVESLE
jgi:hypothetical protein